MSKTSAANEAATAVRVIADAAQEAAKVIANAAAEATKISALSSSADHDLVVQISEQIRGIKQDIVALNASVSDKTGDHEARIRKLEDRQTTWVGGLLVLQFTIGIALWYFGQ